MDNITVLTASNYAYKDIVKRNVENCKKFGHKIIVYDLGGLGFGIKKEIDEIDFEKKVGSKIKRCFFKPEIILETIKENKNVIWVDGDAYVNIPIDFPFDFDLGFTAREEFSEIKGLGFINSGVTMINSNTNSYEFVKEWIKGCELSDQKFINDKVCQYISKDTEFKNREMEPISFEATMVLNGKPRVLKIKIFPAVKYNDYRNFEKDSYVHHFKGMDLDSLDGERMRKKYKEVFK